jgi:hypothetical protein
MDTANDGSLNRHGGTWQDGATPAEERAAEREEAVREKAGDILSAHTFYWCPECEHYTTDFPPHISECELLRARAEEEVK